MVDVFPSNIVLMSDFKKRRSSRNSDQVCNYVFQTIDESSDDSTAEISDKDEYDFKNPHKHVTATLSNLFVHVRIFITLTSSM